MGHGSKIVLSLWNPGEASVTPPNCLLDLFSSTLSWIQERHSCSRSPEVWPIQAKSKKIKIDLKPWREDLRLVTEPELNIAQRDET